MAIDATHLAPWDRSCERQKNDDMTSCGALVSVTSSVVPPSLDYVGENGNLQVRIDDELVVMHHSVDGDMSCWETRSLLETMSDKQQGQIVDTSQGGHIVKVDNHSIRIALTSVVA